MVRNTGMSGSSMFAYTNAKPRSAMSLSKFLRATSKSFDRPKRNMSSYDGSAIVESKTHTAICARAKSSGGIAPTKASHCASVSAFSASSISLSACEPFCNIALTRGTNERNSSSSIMSKILSFDTASPHSAAGSVKSIGASRRTVASVLENSASSSLSFINCAKRFCTPASLVTSSTPFLLSAL
jgi:hypothetical protein